MFENVDGRTDGRTTDGRTTDAGVTGILIAHLGAFSSGELKTDEGRQVFYLYTMHNKFSNCFVLVSPSTPDLELHLLP